MIKSKIYLKEVISNKERKFGEALKYQPVIIVNTDGTEEPGLLTISPVNEAIERAKRNPEDIPEKRGFLASIFG